MGRRLPTFCALFALAAPVPAFAAAQTATAQAVTVMPLSVVKTADLEFGSLIATAAAGKAIVDPVTDARVVSGGVIAAAGATPSAAVFVTAGAPDKIVKINFPNSITISNGAQTMLVSPVTTDGNKNVRQFRGDGTVEIRIAGTLNVAANQAPGAYTGTFVFTVDYN